MSPDPVRGVVPPNGGGGAAADAPFQEAVEADKSAAEPQHFLQHIKLFSTLSVDDCQQVVKRMKRRDFLPNQLIVREGAPGNSMFFITGGLVEIRKKDPHTGIDFLLSEMGPGQNFGEMARLTGKPRTASVTSVQPTTCAVLEQADFHDLLMQYPKIGLALTTVLAERVENATQHVGIEFINLAKMHFDPRVLGLLPLPMVLQHKVIPIAFINNRLSLAMVNPNNIVALDDIRRIIKGVMVEPVVITEEDFKKFMSTTRQPARARYQNHNERRSQNNPLETTRNLPEHGPERRRKAERWVLPSVMSSGIPDPFAALSTANKLLATLQTSPPQPAKMQSIMWIKILAVVALVLFAV